MRYFNKRTTTLLYSKVLLDTYRTTTPTSLTEQKVPDKHKLIIELNDDDSEDTEYVASLIEMILLERLPDNLTFEIVEYEEE